MANRSSSEFAIVLPGRRLGSRCFAELSSVCRRPTHLPRYRATHEPAEQPGGEGWLVSAEQQKVVQFKPDASTVHAQWVAVRTYNWIPPNRCLRPGDGCCGTTPSKPGTRCSKRAGGAVHHRCADGIKNRSPPRDRHDAIKEKIGLVLALSLIHI